MMFIQMGNTSASAVSDIQTQQLSVDEWIKKLENCSNDTSETQHILDEALLFYNEQRRLFGDKGPPTYTQLASWVNFLQYFSNIAKTVDRTPVDDFELYTKNMVEKHGNDSKLTVATNHFR